MCKNLFPFIDVEALNLIGVDTDERKNEFMQENAGLTLDLDFVVLREA